MTIVCMIAPQACGVLCAVEPLNSFLASLCKFTINFPSEMERRRYEIAILLYNVISHYFFNMKTIYADFLKKKKKTFLAGLVMSLLIIYFLGIFF